MPVPEEFVERKSPSTEFVKYLIEKAGTMVTPALVLESLAEGYCR